MTASTLAGRGFLRGTRAHRDQIEGWLALGATPVRGHRDIAAEAVRETLLPQSEPVAVRSGRFSLIEWQAPASVSGIRSAA